MSPFDDPLTLALLMHTDALGVPEFGTPFVREIIDKVNPQSFSDFVEILGLSKGKNARLDNADVHHSFPKAQAVEYTMMAFRIAWFKAHYPLAFYSVYFEVVAGHASYYMTGGPSALSDMIEELHQKKRNNELSVMEEGLLTVLAVGMEFYKYGFSMSKAHVSTSEATAYVLGDECLTPPLVSIPHVGDSVAAGIVEERALAPFLSAEDCIMRLRARGISQPLCDELRGLF